MAPRDWWHIVDKLLQCLQFPAWKQPLSPAWRRLRFPAWEHLPVPRPSSSTASTGTVLLPNQMSQIAGHDIVAQLLQCLQFPAWEQPPSPAWGRLRSPAWEHLPVPCLGTLAVPAWDARQFPAWEQLPVPCLGTLASVHALPGLAGSLLGNTCQFPALERLPVPCLETLASSLPGNACQCACPGLACFQSLPGTLASSLPENA